MHDHGRVLQVGIRRSKVGQKGRDRGKTLLLELGLVGLPAVVVGIETALELGGDRGGQAEVEQPPDRRCDNARVGGDGSVFDPVAGQQRLVEVEVEGRAQVHAEELLDTLASDLDGDARWVGVSRSHAAP